MSDVETKPELTVETLQETLQHYAEQYQQAEAQFRKAEQDIAQKRDVLLKIEGAYLAMQGLVNSLNNDEPETTKIE